MKTKLVIVNQSGKEFHITYAEHIPSRGDSLLIKNMEFKVLQIKWNYDKNDNHVKLFVEDITE